MVASWSALASMCAGFPFTDKTNAVLQYLFYGLRDYGTEHTLYEYASNFPANTIAIVYATTRQNNNNK